MSRWYASSEGPVRVAAACAEGPEVSPTGAYLAWLPARAGGVPLEERERVRVVDLHTDDEVCVLEGRGNVRTLHFVSDAKLLVTRDAKGGTWLGMYEIPGGNLLSEGFLPGVIEQRHDARHTPDGRVLCLSPRDFYAGDRSIWLLDGETLSPRTRTSGAEALCALHPDGELLAVLGFDFGEGEGEGEGEFVELATDPPVGPRVRLDALPESSVVARWAGRHELRVAYSPGSGPEGALAVATVDVRAGALRQAFAEPLEGLAVWELSPDGAHLFALRTVASRSGPATAHLRVIDAERGADVVTVVRPCASAGGGGACAFGPDERSLAVVVSNSAEWSVYVVDLSTGATRGLTLGPAGNWAYACAVHGPWFAERASREPAFRLVDLREAR